MIEDNAIVSQHHALLQPGLTVTEDLVDAAHMAVLRGEISVAEFEEVHGAEAKAWLARELGETEIGHD